MGKTSEHTEKYSVVKGIIFLISPKLSPVMGREKEMENEIK